MFSITADFFENVVKWYQEEKYARILDAGVNALENGEPSGKSRILIFCFMSSAAVKLSQYNHAWSFASTAYSLALLWGFREEKVYSLNLQSEACIGKKEFSTALQLTQEARKFYEMYALSDQSLLVGILYNEVIIATEGNLGIEPDIARFNQLLAIYDKGNAPVKKAEVSVRMANYFLLKTPADTHNADACLKLVQSDELDPLGRIHGQYDLAKGRLQLARGDFSRAADSFYLVQMKAHHSGNLEDIKIANQESEKLRIAKAAAKPPAVPLIHQYGGWIAGAAVAATIVGISCVMKTK